MLQRKDRDKIWWIETISPWRKRFAYTRWRHRSIRWRYIGYAMTILFGMTFGVSATLLNSEKVQATNSTNCADVEFIFVRGSGEVLDEAAEKGKSFVAWRSSIKAALSDIDITTKFYNLGSESHNGYQYPATTVSGSLQGIINLTGAYFSAGEAYDFARSVEQGRGELVYYLIEEMQQCPNMKFVLGGYSQGAMILTKTLNQLYAPRILYVATFGDPKLYLPEGAGTFRVPDACRGVNLSPYREYVPDCHAYTGVLGSVRPYQPEAYAGKLGTWCNQSDIMCSSGFSIKDHSAYVKTGLYSDAAQVIRQKIKAAFPEKESTSNSNGLHNLALLFDITGSMKHYFEKYRQVALRLTAEALALGGKVEFYTFGDVGHDMYPTLECKDCTVDDLDNIIKNLKIGNGGDLPESLLSAAMYAMDNFDWTYGATKTLIALTDATFHPNDNGITVDDVIKRSLEIDPVNIHVVTSEEHFADYQDLVVGTGGVVYDIDKVGVTQLALQQMLLRPVAKLSTLDYTGKVGSEFQFDASSSYSYTDEALHYDWDLDGDGVYELLDVGAVVRKTYTENFSGYVQVRVGDIYGSSTMSAKVDVSENYQESMLPQIKDVQVEEKENGEVKIRFETDAEKVLLGINGALTGLVQLDAGIGEVTLTETFSNMEISLAPYSNNRRGETKELLLLQSDDYDDNLPDLSQGNYGETENPDNSNPSGDTATSLDNTIGSEEASKVPDIMIGSVNMTTEAIGAVKPNNQLSSLVPWAPNTGHVIRSAERYSRSLKICIECIKIFYVRDAN